MANIGVLFVIAYFASFCNCETGPFVSLKQGDILGRYFTTRKGRTVSGFSGIPYAKPPVGELRFKPSVTLEQWNGTLNATQPHAVCPQLNYYDKENPNPIAGSENCLFLNVYTPQVPKDKWNNISYPVLFYIHGGSFSVGSARYDWLGPELLLDKDLVLVTVNYRLGALGFLSTGDDSIPANNGLKDQVLALRWVKDNIATFGGNPEKVTISGNSAGGSSVHYLTLSPMTKGLITSAIIQSGVVISQIAVIPRNESIGYAQRFGEKLNCSSGTSEDLLKCLQGRHLYDIVKQQLTFSTWDSSAIPFLPTIEKNCTDAFLCRNPFKLMQSNDILDIPIMLGIVPNEGIIVSAALSPEKIEQMEETFDTNAFHDFNLESLHLADSLRKFYFGNQTIGLKTRPEITDLYTDGWFLSGADFLVQNHLAYREQPIYFYYFDYMGSESYASLYNDASFLCGASHTDELLYLLSRNVAFPGYKPTPLDDEMTETMTSLWFNFVRYGNPTPANESKIPLWQRVVSNNLEYYHIEGPRNLSMRNNLLSNRKYLWRNLRVAVDVDKFDP
uniref:Carboxylic ester hydrolase n=1 Tax=Photinus pyralis TaxID=7054 RepID=A0A1Y1MFT8_PHOPY